MSPRVEASAEVEAEAGAEAGGLATVGNCVLTSRPRLSSQCDGQRVVDLSLAIAGSSCPLRGRPRVRTMVAGSIIDIRCVGSARCLARLGGRDPARKYF